MSREAKGTTQYGDLHGTVSVDGFDHLMATDLRAKLPIGYRPIGIELHCSSRQKGGNLSIAVYVLGVDCEILDGAGPDAVRSFAKESDEIPVFRFPSDLTLEDILPHVKRLNIVLQDRSTKGKPLMVAEYDTQE